MVKYINKRSSLKNPFVTPLFRRSTGDSEIRELLWGDSVKVLQDSGGSKVKVKARGSTGYVYRNRLTSRSLLELYFVDVGQGDGVLIRTPKGKHILVDGGWPRKSQPTGKNAADFVDWKFMKDYGQRKIALDAMICSHNDQDHYGGLWDLLNPARHDELDADEATIEHFYHAGLSWWRRGASDRTLGPYEDTPDGEMWTRMLEDRASLEHGLRSSGNHPKFKGEWASFLSTVKDAKTKNGDPTPVTRLDHRHGSLDDFESTDFRIHVVGPVGFQWNGQSVIRRFPDGDSKNTNGNSVLLRIDYKKSRFLLTGDLNYHSQKSLLSDYSGRLRRRGANPRVGIFEADVAKSCHHGSGDVAFSFLEEIEPACTIISSGDSEGHDHPKPEIIAASGLTGLKEIRDDRIVTPLIYSTELARSVDLGKITKVEKLSGNQVNASWEDDELESLRAHYKVLGAGDRSPRSGKQDLSERRLAVKNIYGLINVRTDGKTIMTAALNEKKGKWNVSDFQGRFSGPDDTL